MQKRIKNHIKRMETHKMHAKAWKRIEMHRTECNACKRISGACKHDPRHMTNV